MELKCKDTEAVDAEANRTREGRKHARICTRDRVFAREFGSGQKSRVSTSLEPLEGLTVIRKFTHILYIRYPF